MRRGKWKEVKIFPENDRARIITPDMINKVIKVDMGMKKKEIKIKANYVGLRLGELTQTKVTAFYKKGG